MSPASLVVAVAAGLAGAALLAGPAVRSDLASARPPRSALLRLDVTAGPPGPRAPGPRAVGPGAVGPGAVGPGAVGPGAVGPGAVGPRAPAASFRWPLAPAPQVMRRFAVGPHPWSPGHRGVDLGTGAGQHVLAAGAGTVAFAGLVAGRGVVTVAHPGGLRTTYEPVHAGVKVGEAVAAGDELGVVTTGSHCATTCLHWGALRGDLYLDPLTLLRRPSPPILLPLGSGR